MTRALPERTFCSRFGKTMAEENTPQKAPSTKDIRILVVEEEEEVVRAIKLGVNGFLAKPFDHKGLVEKVFQILGRDQAADG